MYLLECHVPIWSADVLNQSVVPINSDLVSQVTALDLTIQWYTLLISIYHAMLEFHETCHSVTFYFMKKKDSKRHCDTTTPESIHTKDESKRGIAFAFIFGVN